MAFRKFNMVCLSLCALLCFSELKALGQNVFKKWRRHETEQSAPATQTAPAKPVIPATQIPEPTVQASQTATPPPEAVTDSASHPDLHLEQLNFQEGDFDWHTDWWKGLILILGILIAFLLLLRIAKQLFRYLVILGCLAIGTAGAYFFGPLAAPCLEKHLPANLLEHIPLLYWGYAVMFLICYIIATIVLRILKRPLDIVDKKQKVETHKD